MCSKKYRQKEGSEVKEYKIQRMWNFHTNILTSTEYAFKLRPGRIDDADAIGKIIYDAFSAIADKHGFQREFPSIDTGIDLASSFLSNPGFYSVVAEGTSEEDKGRIVGSNFLDERSNFVVGVGPITVDPKYQNKLFGFKKNK